MHLRSRLFLSAALVSLPTMVAFAQSATGPYVGLGAGWSHVLQKGGETERFGTNVTAGASGLPVPPPARDEGFVVTGQIGYKTPPGVRLEFEPGYRYNSYTNSSSNQINSISLMTNVIYDVDLNQLLNVDTRFTPYFGIGAGAVRTETVGLLPQGAGVSIDYSDKQWSLGYQGIAGLAYNLSQDVVFGVDYRFFGTTDTSSRLRITNGNAGATAIPFTLPYNNHSILASVRYYFGGPTSPASVATVAPAATIPAAAAAPPAPPPAVPRVQTFLVFFDWDSAQLTGAARDTITAAAQAIKSGNVARLEIVGHTDTTGSPQYNQRLGSRRADAVRDDLIKKGVSHGSITTRSAGKTQLRVPTADNIREPQNRRAEIILPPS